MVGHKKSSRIARMLTVSTLALAAVLATPTAFAQAPAAPAAAAAPTDDIVVIGTRRTDRSATNSASPVDVISAQEISTAPATNIMDAVKAIVPSFFVGQNTISDASTFVRAPSLRGLPGDEVLVMLNGKRFNRSALVQVYTGGDTGLSFGSHGSDISSIPAIALKNLQVLRDGATAQYGSDAIAGVLNYGLRDDKGVEVQARVGQYYDNGGDGDSRQIALNWGFGLGDKGFVNVSAEYFDDDGTSRGATRPIAKIFAQNNPGLAAQLPNFPNPVQIWGSSPADGYKALINSEFDVTAKTQVYAFANFAKSTADQSFNYRSPIGTTGLQVFDGRTVSATGAPGPNGAFSPYYLTRCPTGNATCPASGFVKDSNIFLLSSVYPAGFTPRFVGETKQAFGVVGYKGAVGDLTFDVAASQSENKLGLSMYNSISPSFGPQSQKTFEFGDLIQKETNFTADFTYPVTVSGLASPVTLAAGAEWRKETYEATPGDLQSYAAGPFAVQNLYVQTAPGVYAFDSTVTKSPAASGYGGTSPQAAGSFEQKSYGFYGSAEADLTKKLTAGVAARWEDYDTFGSTTVGKANAIYAFSDAFKVRATIGTGFHAPSPGQNNVQILTTNFIAGNQVQTGTYPVTSPIAQFYGAQSLKPAKSKNYGIGVVFEPASDITVTVDAYQIDVKDRIGISGAKTVTAADIARLPALAAVGVDGNVNFFTNAFDTRTKGVDIVGTYRTELLGGATNVTLAYNYNKSDVTRRDRSVITDDQVINVRNLAPNHRANLSANWSRGNFLVTVRENYYGSWRNETDYPGQKFGAKLTTDLDVSYTFKDHYTLTVGASNLFNEYPDKIAATPDNRIFLLTNSTADGQIYPRNGGPFGINGGFYYTRLRVKY
ncbi:MAG: TonB-dependent receptor [Alphaproteobacteria bacterium]|nr:TonB-dependent receptor [Alphaproteobacteria bacterium]